MVAGNWTGWTDDIVQVLKFAEITIDDVFTLARIYDAEHLLKKMHPNNNHIKAKIRQQLQILQDYGYIEFIDNNGHYRIVKPLPNAE